MPWTRTHFELINESKTKQNWGTLRELRMSTWISKVSAFDAGSAWMIIIIRRWGWMDGNLKMKIEKVFQSVLHKLSYFTKLNTIEFEIQWQSIALGW